MKALTREFTPKEKALLLLLILILVGLAYYQFVDQPVRTALANARSERESLNVELKTVQEKLKVMRRMRDEMEDITAGGTVSEMKSYNNSKAEIALLNDILRDTPEYSIKFDNVTRDKDQIRRRFTLQFTTDNFQEVERIIGELSASPYRCLVGDLKIGTVHGVSLKTGEKTEGVISTTASATFYETMVGGTVDAGLPADKSAAK